MRPAPGCFPGWIVRLKAGYGSSGEHVLCIGKNGANGLYEWYYLLHQFVVERGYAERSSLSVFLRDMHSSRWLGRVAFVFQRKNQFLNAGKAYTVDGFSICTLCHITRLGIYLLDIYILECTNKKRPNFGSLSLCVLTVNPPTKSLYNTFSAFHCCHCLSQ